MSNGNNNQALANRPQNVKVVLSTDSIQNRIKEVLGLRAPQFTASVVSLASGSRQLSDADPHSVVAACMTAALLNLPISKDLGFAHIVPYKGVAQFQMGYKGFVQLAMRTGQYRHLNACPVYEGELVKYDRLSGELVLDEEKKASDKIIGWAAYMQLINGFSHALYWSDEQMEKHAKRFSQAVKSNKTDSPWFTNRDAMCLKTVLKALLSKWGILSVELERALQEDQGVKRTLDAETEFVDNEKNVTEKPVIEEAPTVTGTQPTTTTTTTEEAPSLDAQLATLHSQANEVERLKVFGECTLLEAQKGSDEGKLSAIQALAKLIQDRQAAVEAVSGNAGQVEFPSQSTKKPARAKV